MTYIDPPTLPHEALPPLDYQRPRRKAWPWFAGVGSLLTIALIVIVTLVLTGGDGKPANPRTSYFTSAPEPISRAELMAEYARIAPFDTSATPAAVDSLAQRTCALLDSGKSTDLLIDTATSIYGADATKVTKLLVSYKCPKYLKDFK
jgi:hypothetical protein